MNASSIRDTDVLIVGAGPTGLVLALWLTELGVRVRIVDKTAEPGTTSRAVAVQARTLELYNQVVLADMGAGLSPYPYALIFPQDEHERLLIDRLADAGIKVERQVELLDFDD